MGYTKTSLREVENQAPKFGMPDELDARFARTPLEGESLGLSIMKLDPGFRIPFGHKHAGQEEVYVVVRGSGRVKVEDEVVEESSLPQPTMSRARQAPITPAGRARRSWASTTAIRTTRRVRPRPTAASPPKGSPTA